MKKTFTSGLLFVICCGIFVSCSKDVKTPAKVAKPAAASTTTTTTGSTPQTNYQNQGSGHTCGGSSSTNYGGSGS